MILYYFQNLSIQEITTTLSSSENSIKNALYKGRNSLKIRVGKEEEEEEQQDKLSSKSLSLEALLLAIQKKITPILVFQKLRNKKFGLLLLLQKKELLLVSILKFFIAALGSFSNLILALFILVIATGSMIINYQTLTLNPIAITGLPSIQATADTTTQTTGNNNETNGLSNFESIKNALEKQSGMAIENFNEIANF